MVYRSLANANEKNVSNELGVRKGHAITWLTRIPGKKEVTRDPPEAEGSTSRSRRIQRYPLVNALIGLI